MKKLCMLAVAAVLAAAPKLSAESLVTESGTWDVTRTTTTLADGVTMTKLKWNTSRSASYTGSLVYVIEADLTNPTVGLEMITPGMTGTKTLANHAKAAKTGTAVAGANANFWITSPEAGNYACMGEQSHGIDVSNGVMYTDANMGNFKHCGGPRTRTGIFIVDNDGKAYLDFTKTQKANNASGSGVQFAAANKTTGERMALDMCNRWVAAGSASIFTKEYGSTKAFRTGNKTSDTYTKVTGQATEVLLDFAPGTTDWNLGGTTKFVVKEIRTNKGGGTLGDHDCAIVSRDSLATVCAEKWAVGHEIDIDYKINFKNQGSPNGIAQATSGNVLAMQNGEFTTAIQAQEDAGNTYNTNWYARTLYGLNADRTKFYILVCEHYPNKTYSNVGFTTKQMCHIAKTFGCTEAFQPDCGGSAQMWTAKNGQVTTSTDVGGVRAVHNGLFIVTKEASTDPTPTPTLTSTCASTAFGTVNVGDASAKTFSVSGSGLTANITLKLSGTDAAQFAVTPASLSAGGNFTITYKPTAEGAHTATLTIASTGATSLKYTLTGTGKVIVGPEPIPVAPIVADDIKEEYVYSTNTGNLNEIKEFTSNSGNVTRDMCVINSELILLHAASGTVPVVTRHDAYNPSLCLGNVNVDGVTGGTYYLGGVKRLGNTMIGASMVGAAGTLKIYQWKDLSEAPKVILSTSSHGDIEVGRSLMTSGDETDGKISFAAAAGNKIVYFAVKDGVINPTPVIINLTNANGSAYAQGGNSSNQDVSFMADGSFWLFNKDTFPVHFDATGKLITTLTTTHMGSATKKFGQGGQVFTYAGNDYVAATATLGSSEEASWGNVTMSLVDISEGSTKARHIGTYPAAGLGAASWGNIANNAVDYQVEGDDEGLNLWVLAPNQGLARYSVGKVSTGVNNIKVDGCDAQVEPVFYNLNGVRVATDRLAPGLYIRVRGTKSDKVIIR